MTIDPAARCAIVRRLRAAGCVFAEEEAALLTEAADTETDLTAMAERRASGVPLEVVVGWALFCGLRIAVEPGVFVPRRRTEWLATQAAALARPGAAVVDLCCGTGAVGAALAAAMASIEVYAVDIEAAAVRCARKNLPAGARVYEGDLYDPLPRDLQGRVDVLVCNAPYVPTDSIELMPREARLYEPHVALDGGADGLHVQRRVAAAATTWLAPGGHLLMETSERQASGTARILSGSGLVPRVVRSEDLDATVAIGTRPPIDEVGTPRVASELRTAP